MKNIADELRLYAQELHALSPSLRLGQCYMNALSEIDLDLYRQVTADEEFAKVIDPFYDDDRIPALREWVMIDPIIFRVAKIYDFRIKFCPILERFSISHRNVKSHRNDFFWSSADGVTEFFTDLKEYFQS